MQPIETQAAVQRLFRFADDSTRAARIARLARSVGEKTGDDFFKWIAMAVEVQSDIRRLARSGMRSMGERERDSLVSTAFAQAVPR